MAYTGPMTDRIREARQRHADAMAEKRPKAQAVAKVKSITTNRPSGTTTTSTPSTTPSTTPMAQAMNNITNQSRSNQTLGRIDNLVSSQPFQFSAPQPFDYDPEDDPAYQAALRTARDNIRQQQADTNARLRATGQGRSSFSETLANQIGSREMARVSDTVLPQLISQAYQRYVDQANRGLQTQQLNYGAQQDQIGNLGNLYGLYNQEDFANPMAEAQLTGTYLPGNARQLINNLIGLKQEAEAPGITRYQRTGLSEQADTIRSQLQGLGVDPSLFSRDVTANQSLANFARAGTPTLEAATDQRNFDRSVLESDRAFDRGVLEADRTFEYQQARDAIADEQWRAQFDEDVRRFGLDFALQQQQARQSMANMAADNRRADAAAGRAARNDAEARLFRIWEATGYAPEGIEGVAPGTPLGGGSVPEPTKNEIEAEYYTMLDRLSDDQLKRFFQDEKANIIADLGKSGYDTLRESYGIYD